MEFLEQLNKNHIHGKNILAKLKKQDRHIELFLDQYKEFLSKMDKDINIKIEAFKNYKMFVSKYNKYYSAQSKFESTILEEFLYHLFKEFGDGQNIFVGNIKAYSNLYFSPKNFDEFKNNNFIKINQKDQDFAIYKKVLLNDDNSQYEIFVPVVAIECKTYLDKTMLEGSVATAEKIKQGNPHCKFYIVTETYEVNYSVDPSTSRIDNIFVLKKGNRSARGNEYYNDVFIALYNETKKHLNTNWADIQANIENKGTIF